VRAPILATSASPGWPGASPWPSTWPTARASSCRGHILKKYLPAEWVDRRKTGFGMPPSFIKAHAEFFGQQLGEAVHDGSALSVCWT
jgi:hypothetical protein